MDDVNRLVAVNMMVRILAHSSELAGHDIDCHSLQIETANASNRKQYILITPQDMTNVSIGPTVRVHRMSDPERGQGVLSM